MSENTPPLVVIGTVAIDTISTPFGANREVFGGSGSYFSYAASFFAPVGLVAVVGKDFPEEYRDILKERPIDLSHLKTLAGSTFRWAGKYEGDMNSATTLQTDLNVLLDFKPELHYTGDVPFLFLANIDPDLQLEILNQAQAKRPKWIACDTMNFWIQNKLAAFKHVLARVDAVILNDGEARALSGESNLLRAAQKINAMGPNYVIIKKGEHGGILYHDKQLFVIPAYPLEEVFDPTGAGDSFAGAMMGYLASTGQPTFANVCKAMAYGTVTASFTVENFGLERLRRLTRAEIDDRLELLKKISTI